MKKIILSVLLGILIALGFSGCNNNENNQVEEKDFNATIIECSKNSMLVIPDTDEFEFKSSDKFIIEFTDEYKTCNVNDKVEITYIGDISEVYPAKVNTIKIESISN